MATKDFTHALREARARRKAKSLHNSAGSVAHEASRGKGGKKKKGKGELGKQDGAGFDLPSIMMDRRTSLSFTHQSSLMLPSQLNLNVCSSEVPHISNTPSPSSRPLCSSWKVCKRAPVLTEPTYDSATLKEGDSVEPRSVIRTDPLEERTDRKLCLPGGAH
jgi:hypothetical protein